MMKVKQFHVDLNTGSQQVDGFCQIRRLGAATTGLELDDPVLPHALEMIMVSVEEGQFAFQALSSAAQVKDVPLDQYIPEPKSL